MGGDCDDDDDVRFLRDKKGFVVVRGWVHLSGDSRGWELEGKSASQVVVYSGVEQVGRSWRYCFWIDVEM